MGTTGVNEVDIMMIDHGKKITVRAIDPGGQTNKRSKWIELFEDVSTIFFVVSMAGYDCAGDSGATNDLRDAMNVFKKTVNSRCFLLNQTPVVLFLNKLDIFRKKIKARPLNEFFSSAPKGKHAKDEKALQKWFTSRFKKMFVKELENQEEEEENIGRKLKIHFCTATDSDHARVLLDKVTSMLVMFNLKGGGVIN